MSKQKKKQGGIHKQVLFKGKGAEEILKNWNTTANFLKSAKLKEVEALLEYEMNNRRRPHIANRLFTRASTLRVSEERKKLLEEIEKNG